MREGGRLADVKEAEAELGHHAEIHYSVAPEGGRGEVASIMRDERRRPRKCPGCGGSSIVRGTEVQGVAVTVVPPTEESAAVTVPAYWDVCYGCGMLTLFVRVSEAQ